MDNSTVQHCKTLLWADNKTVIQRQWGWVVRHILFGNYFDYDDCHDEDDEEDNVDATNVMLMTTMMMTKMMNKMMLMQPMWKEMGETLPSLITCRGGGGGLWQS